MAKFVEGDRMELLYQYAIDETPLPRMAKVLKNKTEKEFYIGMLAEVKEKYAEAKKNGKDVNWYFPNI